MLKAREGVCPDGKEWEKEGVSVVSSVPPVPHALNHRCTLESSSIPKVSGPLTHKRPNSLVT